MNVKELLLKLPPIKYYAKGRNIFTSPEFIQSQNSIEKEKAKTPSRTEVINYLLSVGVSESTYLEIGVRNPEHNFNHINASVKYSVDPGVEFESNPVDFKMTSDDFFEKLRNSEILSADIKFDVIFIDGLHLAEQVDRDIENALHFIKNDGFIVLHDCNPPTEWTARENYEFFHTPALGIWNGTTWKAFLKRRFDPSIQSCCIDTDWGVGILSKSQRLGNSIEKVNPYFEYGVLDQHRNAHLNLIDFNTLKGILS